MPTDTFTQIIAQAMGGSGYAMAFVLAAAFLLMLCVVGIIGSVLEARQRRIDDEQRLPNWSWTTAEIQAGFRKANKTSFMRSPCSS